MIPVGAELLGLGRCLRRVRNGASLLFDLLPLTSGQKRYQQKDESDKQKATNDTSNDRSNWGMLLAARRTACRGIRRFAAQSVAGTA